MTLKAAFSASPLRVSLFFALSLGSLGSAAAEEIASKVSRWAYATEGPWTVEYLTDGQGQFVEAQATRKYNGGNLLRIGMHPQYLNIDFHGKGVDKQGEEFPVQTSWIAKGQESDPVTVDAYAALVEDEAGIVWGRVQEANADGPGSMDSLTNANRLVVEAEEGKWTFELDKSHPAMKSLQKCLEAAPGPKKKTKQATAAPAENTAPKLEKIALTKDAPSTRWDVKLPADGSKTYLVPVKKGQTVSVSFLEDTRQGLVDFGKASIEEGLASEGYGLSLDATENKEHRLTLYNPTDKPLVFTVYISVAE